MISFASSSIETLNPTIIESNSFISKLAFAEIISVLLSNYNCSTSNQCTYNDNLIPYYWGNGAILLIREVTIGNNQVDLEYCFDFDCVKVGIRETEKLKELYPNTQFSSPTDDDSGETEDGWICRKIYSYQEDVKQKTDIDNFILKIEKEILGNSNSTLISKLTIQTIES